MTENERDNYGYKLIAIKRDYDEGNHERAFHSLIGVVARLVGDVHIMHKEAGE